MDHFMDIDWDRGTTSYRHPVGSYNKMAGRIMSSVITYGATGRGLKRLYSSVTGVGTAGRAVKAQRLDGGLKLVYGPPMKSEPYYGPEPMNVQPAYDFNPYVTAMELVSSGPLRSRSYRRRRRRRRKRLPRARRYYS